MSAFGGVRGKIRALGAEALWVLIGLVAQLVGQTGTLKLVTSRLARSDYGVLVLANSASALVQLGVFGAIVHGMMRVAPPLLRAGRVDALVGATRRVAQKPWILVGFAATVLAIVAVGARHGRLAPVIAAAAAITYSDYRSGRTQGLAQVARLRALAAGQRAVESIMRGLFAFAALKVLPDAPCALGAFAAASLAVNVYFERIVASVVTRPATGEDEHLPALREVARDIGSFASPLAAASILTWATTSADRWLVEQVGSLGDAAVYAAAGQVGTIPFTILGSVMQAFAFPLLYARSKKGDKVSMAWVGRLGLLYATGASVGLGTLVMLRRPVIHLLLGAQLWDAAGLLPWTALGWALFQLSQMLSLGPMVTGATRNLIGPTIVAAITTITMNVILTPRFGAYGAAWALVASGAARSCAMFFENRKALRLIEMESTVGGHG